MAQLKLSPPWIKYMHEMEQLFKYDPEVHVIYDEDEHIIHLYVDKQRKADALATLIPETVTFGNITLQVNVVPANGALSTTAGLTNAQLFENAFEGNGAFAFVRWLPGIFSNNLTYVVFKNKVVQYFNDNLSDVYGNCNTLYQDIAKNIFGEIAGVYFCTDIEQPVTMQDKLDNYIPVFSPEGCWP